VSQKSRKPGARSGVPSGVMKRFLSSILALSAALSQPVAEAQQASASPAASSASAAPAPAVTADVASLPDLSSDEIAARVQAFYDGAKTFQAAFNQRYTIFAYNKKKASQGRVAFVKPGKMSWRYTNNGNRVVSDGRLLKVYDADNKQSYEQEVGKSAYPAALSFLLGEGKLTGSFAIKKLNAETVGFKGGYVLLAIPREPTPAYQKMLLYVDGKTFQVRRVQLIDAQRNTNVFDFSDPVVNLPVSPSEFQFAAPPGTQIIKP
jgi:outer membrane lipoprotein carrier protein